MVLLLATLFVIAGATCVTSALWIAGRDYWRTQTWCVAQGQVVRQREVADADVVMSFPVVQFIDRRGETIVVHSTSGGYPPRYDLGATVQVCYRPEHPEEAEILGGRRWACVLLGVMGVLSVAAGAAISQF